MIGKILERCVMCVMKQKINFGSILGGTLGTVLGIMVVSLGRLQVGTQLGCT